ncbi:MAG: GNAT family N-acetyltransferase [bacterium]
MSEQQATVRRAEEKDLPRIAAINAGVFLGDRDLPDGALQWATCWFKSFPLYQYFVIEIDGEVAGYAGWQTHGGFHRAEPAVELEQIGIDPRFQGQKLGPKLTEASLREVIAWTQETNTRIESHVTLVVWAYTLNFNAMGIYAKTFTDGVQGFRVKYGNRGESMLRVRIPIVRKVRDV